MVIILMPAASRGECFSILRNCMSGTEDCPCESTWGTYVRRAIICQRLNKRYKHVDVFRFFLFSMQLSAKCLLRLREQSLHIDTMKWPPDRTHRPHWPRGRCGITIPRIRKVTIVSGKVIDSPITYSNVPSCAHV